MISGLYAAMNGMTSQLMRQEIITYNLANSGVTGFKKEDVVFRSFPDIQLDLASMNDFDGLGHPVIPRVSKLGTGAGIDWIYTDFSQGQLAKTDDVLNISIVGEGFFNVQTSKGVRYTRNGDFYLSNDGTLTTSNGDPVLGENGQIKLRGINFTVAADGTVAQDGTVIDRIKISTIDDPNLFAKEGESYFRLPSGLEDHIKDVIGNLAQGYREKANYSVPEQMVTLIDTFRTYEANQKMIQASDSTLDRAVNDVGRV